MILRLTSALTTLSSYTLEVRLNTLALILILWDKRCLRKTFSVTHITFSPILSSSTNSWRLGSLHLKLLVSLCSIIRIQNWVWTLTFRLLGHVLWVLLVLLSSERANKTTLVRISLCMLKRLLNDLTDINPQAILDINQTFVPLRGVRWLLRRTDIIIQIHQIWVLSLHLILSFPLPLHIG